MLSQDEINALFGTPPAQDNPADSVSGGTAPVSELDSSAYLSEQDKDVLGEVGNISMGTAASTLSTLLGQRVEITTPAVRVQNWDDIARGYDRPCVGIKVNYVEGLDGVNILVMKERDVKIISDLMMGGDGLADPSGEINEIDLSAISECMNQMIGSSSTSLSSIVKSKIDIDSPSAFLLDFGDENFFENVQFVGSVVTVIRFRMEIGNLIDSEIMQVWPMEFATEIVNIFMAELNQPPKASTVASAPPRQEPASPPPMSPLPTAAPLPPAAPPLASAAPPPQEYAQQPPPGYPPYGYPPPGYYPPPPAYAVPPPQPHISAQPVAFESFDPYGADAYHKENIDIIMDVPLDVTVELGRTSKKIKEILEFQPGSIVELNKLAGETMDILINGKFVARGEVVVIDENFAVRITDIINAENRI
ncbi:MAG: flagellar motor switch phosphatase FliY [Defluviitaleaceae bacterium]|nr:flagellar motor switch phosphatase FliY [Defluviitaleaceae bacterium]MCL2835856.1 flagellar motor switch phosphatase FliY [Defluviitaleaceae bacterium]